MLGYTISFSAGGFSPAAGPDARRSGDERRTHRLRPAHGPAPAPRLRPGGRAVPHPRPAAAALVHGPAALHGLRPAHRPLQPARDRPVPARLARAATTAASAPRRRAARWPRPTSGATTASSWTRRMSMVAAARLELPVDADLRRLNVRAAFAVDSTTIDLCLKLFPWARFRRRKGGIKAHVVLDLRVGIPVFMRVSHAKALGRVGAGPARVPARRVLRPRPRLRRLRAAVPPPPGRRVLRHPRQAEHGLPRHASAGPSGRAARSRATS